MIFSLFQQEDKSDQKWLSPLSATNSTNYLASIPVYSTLHPLLMNKLSMILNQALHLGIWFQSLYLLNNLLLQLFLFLLHHCALPHWIVSIKIKVYYNCLVLINKETNTHKKIYSPFLCSHQPFLIYSSWIHFLSNPFTLKPTPIRFSGLTTLPDLVSSWPSV